jgi:hypothetical protein
LLLSGQLRQKGSRMLERANFSALLAFGQVTWQLTPAPTCDDVQPSRLDVLHSRGPAALERMRVLTSNMSGFKSLRLVRESV